jgi:hypothetical protein
MFFAWPLVGAMAGGVTEAVAGSGAMGWVLTPLLLVWGAAMAYCSRLTCPQCGQHFYARVVGGVTVRFMVAQACTNCGIEFGTPKNP